jgi:dolichol-phosphate mannosyltransferase
MTRVFDYDLHGIVRIRSMRRLPELGYFGTEEPSAPTDVQVRIVRDPDTYRRDDSIRYAEVLGRLGFSIVINRSDDLIDVFASPLIGASPHVLYTNVVEPLLRWLLVRKGHALMHGACLAYGGKAIFITARTDTGKTTTVLHAVRRDPEHCTFLSDDMTILDPEGRVLCFPKPLTISQHTLEAVGGAPLTPWERLALQVQSRLHSRQGRRTGLRLSSLGLPAATLNAIVQKLIPPPKYMVDRIIPAVRYGTAARLAGVVVIERGPALQACLEGTEAIDILSANADDAYGFPPYPAIAEHMRTWNGVDLLGCERSVVSAALHGVPAVRLRSPSYDWHERLPHLIEGSRDQPAPGQASQPVRSGAPNVPRLLATESYGGS